jgi:hypothetical protein
MAVVEPRAAVRHPVHADRRQRAQRRHSAFNVIIMPSGNVASLGKGEGLKRWVEGGGVLITFGGATGWATREDVGFTSARRVQCEAKKDLKAAPAKVAPVDSLSRS